jgi:hypothetical protein
MKTTIIKVLFLFLIIIMIHLLSVYKTIEGFQIKYNVEGHVDNITTNIKNTLDSVKGNLDSITFPGS